jgi:hypothetical protein
LATEQKKEQQIKVTDKRIFTAEGDIKEEFRSEVKPVEPIAAKPPEPEPEPAAETKNAARQEERRRTMKDKAQNPGTPFTDFVEPLIAQAYMSLGLLRNPYQQKPAIDVGAARQMIEIITMLKEKTEGNLTPDEEDFLATHLGELKLAFVQRTKTI